MKFLLFGTGDYYERFKKWFDDKEVLALLDNSLEKQNTLIDGIRVMPPKEGVKLPFDVIVILSFYVKTMRRQLMELGVPGDKIFHFYDLHKLIYKKGCRKRVEYYGNEKKILLLSQDMALGGASIALFHAACILVANNYKVVFASMIDGPLREKLLSNNIPVIVDVNLQLETMKDVPWINGFSLIFCSTINYHVFLSERDNKIPVIWWLHDAAFFYDGIDKELLGRLDRTNMKICTVGSIPENAVKRYIPDIETEELLYGVADTVGYAGEVKYRNDRTCFAVIGDIGDVKGQDILIRAVQELPENLRRKTRFYLIGRNTSMMARLLKEEIKDTPEVIMTGIVGRKRINEIFDESDVLICPSREDSMPMAAAEAMMHRIPCIVSDAAGTARYIQDGMDGFVFHSEAVDELSGKIIWCIENREKLRDMGIRSRKIYDTYFSMAVFEKELLSIVDSMLYQE